MEMDSCAWHTGTDIVKKCIADYAIQFARLPSKFQISVAYRPTYDCLNAPYQGAVSPSQAPDLLRASAQA